jgi:O-antigen/teichoic acid export membrane protein
MGMLISTAITILLTPYLLKHLGSERYGIYSLAFSVLHYLVLLEFGMRGAVARFAAKYIQADDPQSLSGVVSVAMMFSVLLGSLSILLSYGIGYVALDFFNVSSNYRTQTLVLFVAMGVNLAFSLLSYSLSGVLIGSQRYDLENVKIILTGLINASLVVLFFSLGWVSLSSWAAAMVLASLVGQIYLFITARFLQPKLRIGFSKIRLEILKEMLGFGGWNVFLQVATLVTSSVNPIIIGRILGSAVVPFYSIPYMLVTRLQSGISGLTSTLMPYASAALNTGDKTMLAHLLKKGTYTAALLLFPLGGCLMVMCKDLFRVWLPQEFEPYWFVFAILMTAYFGTITQTTSYYILLGGGEIKGLSIVYLAESLVIIILSIVLMKNYAFGVYGAAAALAIPRFLSTCLFQPWYTCRQVGIRFGTYMLESYLQPSLCTIPSLILAGLLLYFFPPGSLFVWILEYVLALVPFAILGVAGVYSLPILNNLPAYLADYIRKKQDLKNC